MHREIIDQMDYKNLEMLSWLVGQFRKAGEKGITFDELIDKLFEAPDLDRIMTKRTFHNYLKELRDRFGIKIDCDKRLQYDVVRKTLSEENKRYRYRIVEDPKSDNAQWTMPFLMAFETAAAIKQLQDSEEYYDVDMRRGTAIVMGTEATGLTEVWRQAADAHIRIPILGQLDSLNLSVSTSVLLYEEVRQRRGER